MDGAINVRKVSYDIVTKVLNDGYFLNDVITDTFDKRQIKEKQKRSYISRLSRGVIERFIELDAIISTYSNTKLSKLNPNIKNILRLSVYELKYMDSVPESATCNEYVKLAGKIAPVRLKGFVNGILRNMIRDNFSKVNLKPNEEVSLPGWLYDMLEEEFGSACEIGKSFLKKSQLTIRTNLTKCTPSELVEILREEGVTIEPIPELDYAFTIDNIDNLSGIEAFNKGLFYVQDISSMMVGDKSGVRAGDTVIDVCASPGGKSLHVAELMKVEAASDADSSDFRKGNMRIAGEGGNVLSFDISEEKVKLIKDNIKRTGLTNITAKVGDARIKNNDLTEKADIVIADVPCSGIGVIGKKPDIKARLKKEDIESLSKLQYEILSNVKSYVKTGGKLIYSTCTISKRENEDNVKKFLENNREFTLLEQTEYLPDEIRDGFFIAILLKEDEKYD